MQKTLAIFFIFSLWLPLQAMAQNTPASPYAPLQEAKSKAAALLKQKQYAEAFTAYSQLLREAPTDDVINLGYARAALHTKQPGQAVMAYERLLTKYPTQPILLRELSYALRLQNDTQRSAMELAKNPAAKTANDQLHAPVEDSKNTKITGKLRAGLIYDSNVNGGPATNNISLGSWNVNLSDGQAQESFGGYASGQISVLHRLQDNAPWWLVADAGFFAKYNAHEKLYDMGLSSSEWGTASVGLRHLTQKSLLDVRVRTQIFDYAFEQNIFAAGPEVQFAYAVSPTVHLITKSTLAHRSYSSNEDYNGWYLSAGQYIRFFSDNKKHYITLGGRYLGGFAHENIYSYDGFEASLDVNITLPYEIKFSPFISYSGKYYHGPGTFLELEYRNDHKLSAGFTFEIPLDAAWSVELGYKYAHNASNSDLYDYDQHIVNMGIVWKF